MSTSTRPWAISRPLSSGTSGARQGSNLLLDAHREKVRQDGQMRDAAVLLAFAVTRGANAPFQVCGFGWENASCTRWPSCNPLSRAGYGRTTHRG